MASFFGGGQNSASYAEQLAGVQLQTSVYGNVLPLAYGTVRCPASLIDYDDFKAIPYTTTQRVGKGGGGSTVSQTTYTYTAMVVLALCEGPISAINQVWRDKEVGSLSGYGFTLLTGTRPQTPWTYLTSKHPTKAAGYAGFALVCHSAIDLGSSASMKNHSFETKALLATEADPSSAFAYDAKPDAVIPDFLSSAYYGAGWSASQIADLVTGAASYATYCKAAGFVISPLFDEQRPAKEHLQDILDATNSAAVWSAGASGMQLKIVPYGDTTISANGANYIPNTSPLYDLTYDDFLGVVDETGQPTGQDAVKIERVNTQDVFNICPVEFRDRLAGYNPSVVKDPESADVALNGAKEDQPRTLHMITRRAHAVQLSGILAKRAVWVRNIYTFRVGWRFLLLEPMDLVTITDPKQGIDRKIVRIKRITLPSETSEAEGLTIVAEEWPFGVGSSTVYTTGTSDGNAPNVNADPGNAITPIIFEPSPLLTGAGQPQIWLATAGTPNLWGGCNVWVSVDAGASYTKVGSVTQPARMGVTTATFASGSDPDTTNTLAVDLTSSSGTLNSTDVNGRDAYATLSLVENEFVSYQTATLTAANKYNLTSLRRGVYGVNIASHAAGVRFLRLDDAVFKLPYDPSLQGKTLRIKLQSFNAWGGGLQDLSSLTYYTYTPGGALYPAPYNVTVAVSTTQPA